MGGPNCTSARSTISIARSTPAQKPRWLASRTSTVEDCRRKKSARPSRIGLVEGLLEARMHAAQPVDDALRPVEVLQAPLQVPARRRPVQHVAQVADLVGQLDELRLAADRGRVLHLQALALALGKRLVVGDFGDDARDARAERVFQL